PHGACDPASTRALGGKCMCRYDGMTQDTPNHCMCPQGSNLQEGRGCQANACPDSATTRDARAVCKCPKGEELKSGVCVKKRSFLDNILGNVHVGVGVGGGDGGSGSHKNPKGQDTNPPHKGVDGR
ncbi:MAG TPA: hypothetical protein VHE81_19170, partial [Lacipirellulaceae bacterium]|nr:hypothetical protein [Lacipirellulaceae bacterium]